MISLRTYQVIWILCCILALFGCAQTSPQALTTTTPKTFSQSKAELKKAYIAQNFHTEFYCGIDFNPHTLTLLPTQDYTPRRATTSKDKKNVRAKHIEFEHIMPAHRFGKDLQCWKNGGRKMCVKDKQFTQMESDKRNLVPAIGEINADRSNFEYADLDSKTSQKLGQYGKCAVYTDFKNKKFYPRESEKGIIARIYLYMSEHYGITLTEQEEALMRKWDKAHPPTAYEKYLLATQNP